jgi:hypothetical protein
MESKLILGMLLYCVGTALLIGGACWWSLRRQALMPPLPLRLLRSPGESLRRRIHAFDEESIGQFVAVLALPPFVVFLGLLLVPMAPDSWQAAGIAGSFLIGIVVLLAASLWVVRTLGRRRDFMLGYLGERAVAEALAPLLASGYRVFHDVPARARDRDINIDHVVVGPNGVCAVETKTRRRGRSKLGPGECEVTFDGSSLLWPWGSDSHGLEQLEAEAVWLGQWIEQEAGIRLSPRPILCLPGWEVHSKASGRVSVISPSSLPTLVAQGRGETLDADQIATIAQRLDLRCRDVVD